MKVIELAEYLATLDESETRPVLPFVVVGPGNTVAAFLRRTDAERYASKGAKR